MPTRYNPFTYLQRWPQVAKEFDSPLGSALIEMLDTRDRDLEDFLGTLKTAAAGVVLNLRGQVTTVETDRYYPPPNLAPLQPEYFTASLTALGTGATNVEIRKNGVAVASLTPSASSGLHYVALTETWGTEDYATIATTSFGVGARGLIAGLA
jgi:hypothetical protein